MEATAPKPLPPLERKEDPRPAEVVDRIIEDAGQQPETYLRDTVVPEGGE